LFRLLRRLFSIVSALSFVALVVLPFFLFQSERLVPRSEARVFDDVALAKDILKRFNPRHMDPSRETRVSASPDELSRAAGVVASRALPSASADVQVSDAGLRIGATAELPSGLSLFGKFLNAQVVIAPSASGLELVQVSVGSVAIPAWLVQPALKYAIDVTVGEGKGEEALSSIRSVEISERQVSVTFKPPAGLYEDFRDAGRNLVLRDQVPAIRAYYGEIVSVSLTHGTAGRVSLSVYLQALGRLAEARSLDRDAAAENRALILALALYFGDSRFSLLLGADAKGGADDGAFDRSRVTLSQRHDWVQHFVTSAAIQVVSSSDISNFFGEAKEISDADGPSGFSFTDVAADRAGVRFAEVATSSAGHARNVQRALARLDRDAEHEFFPEVKDLPEGLPERSFKSLYGDVGSETYNRLIATIDGRVDRLALLRR
jgi:hypothetical protein